MGSIQPAANQHIRMPSLHCVNTGTMSSLTTIFILLTVTVSVECYYTGAHRTQPQDRGDIVELQPEADWNEAIEKNLARQNLYNNIVKEVFNSLTRMMGWSFIALVLYGSLITSDRRKRDTESTRREGVLEIISRMQAQWES